MHALTGLVPCKISGKNLASEWVQMKRLLSDQSFYYRNAYIVGFCHPDKQISVKSN